MLDIYYFPTPNGRKIAILLEELGVAYTIKMVHIGRGDQFHPDFLRISPNNRMPAIVDHAPKGGGGPVSVFESGAIMMYLAEKEGRFWPQDLRKKYDVAQWVFWQMGNQGPKMGEHGHFHRADAENKHGDLGYPLKRFDNEVHRLYGVLNLGLFEKEWLAAGEYTIADMICYPWAALAKDRGIDIAEFPNVQRWLEKLGERPAMKKALEIGKDVYQGQDKLSPAEREKYARILANQRAVPIPDAWKKNA
ncbi:MAG: glutathione S-transferase N-terminal domain-containing protein [Rhodospirillaceae bacterium]|nr:glutathione S-transferase N-terminal domain-containing protein [Rhodospirillaceae bacterium]